jgi:hypothetical protein
MSYSRLATATMVLLCTTLLGAGSQTRGSSPALETGGAAQADGGKVAQAGRTGQSTSGTGIVEAKDLSAETVTLTGKVYSVVPTTRIQDPKGKVISLKELPVSRMDPRDPIVVAPVAARFEAVETGRGWTLESLQVLGQLPE